MPDATESPSHAAHPFPRRATPALLLAAVAMAWIGGAQGPARAGGDSPSSDLPLVESPPVKSLAMDVRDLATGATICRWVADMGKSSGLPAHFRARASNGLEVAMRDDGQPGDAEAGDGRYTFWAEGDYAVATRAPRKESRARFDGRVMVQARGPAGDVVAGLLNVMSTASPLVIDPARSLLIRDPKVVDDSRATGMGVWSFGYLMQQMANPVQTGIDPVTFTKRWLRKWQFDQVVNEQLVKARKEKVDQLLASWKGADPDIDLAKAPFRLLAIVNRIDLRDGSSGSAGEARFVFGLFDPVGGQPVQMTVIFEFGIRLKDAAEVKAWGAQWAALSTLTIGAPEFNPAMEAITAQFAKAGAGGSRPNGSALNQLRTDDIFFGGTWELREFQLFASDSDAGFLRQVTVKETPATVLSHQPAFVGWATGNAAGILSRSVRVPVDLPDGSPFLAGASENQGGTWFGEEPGTPRVIQPRMARFVASLNTCAACHGAETGTGFLHVTNRQANAAAGLSAFMTGTASIADPADGVPSRSFNDLQRRAEDLDMLVNEPPAVQFLHVPLRMTH